MTLTFSPSPTTPFHRRRARLAWGSWVPMALSTLLVAGCGLSGCQSMPGLPGPGGAFVDTRPRPTPEKPYPPRTIRVPSEVMARLSKGINISFWFNFRENPAYAQEGYFPTDADFANLKRLGFTAVRIEIDPDALLNPAGDLRPDVMAELSAGITSAQRAGLLTVLANLPKEDVKKRLVTDDALLARYETFWQSLAGYYRTTSPLLTVFEVLNEPALNDRPRTEEVSARLLAAVRSVAPEHTVIMPGFRWDGPEDLQPIDAVADPNVIYTFHFYTPFQFTHQGAFWLGDNPPMAKYAGFPWPPTPDAIASLLPAVPADVKPHLEQYGREAWTTDKLGQQIDKAVSWSRAQGGVPLWCGEFGALNLTSGAADRARWIGDVRSLLERRGIGWGYFDFHSNFGLTGTEAAPRGTWDAAAVRGLGLTLPDDLVGGHALSTAPNPSPFPAPAPAP